MSDRPLPPPEWFEDFRLLHLKYGARYEEIRARAIPEAEKRALALDLWLRTEAERKRLMKQAVRKLRCTALKPNGERCTKPARSDFFGQMCSSHAPHIDDYPSLDEVRQKWADHEYNRLGKG